MTDEEFDALLEQSSLGSSGARQLRARVSPEQVALTRRIADQMVHGDQAQARNAPSELRRLLRKHNSRASAADESADGPAARTRPKKDLRSRRPSLIAFPSGPFPSSRSSDVTVAIVTALPVEAHAVRSILGDCRDFWSPNDPNDYRIGTLPSADHHYHHEIVLVQQAEEDGTRNAAVIANLTRTFPQLEVLIMCGIAGGVPRPEDGQHGVRLGDIVVATDGVVDYNHVRSVDEVDTLRRIVSAPSTALLRADHHLRNDEFYRGARPWLKTIEQQGQRPMFRRPMDSSDPLNVAGLWRSDPIVHRGVVGSADRPLRDAVLRDELSRLHRIKAIEMQASGIATAAEFHGLSWFMVRGVADYCDDESKSDAWHAYASMTAAAYAGSLLINC